VAVACGLVKKLGGPDAVGCILTADHIMSPTKNFRDSLRDTIRAAARHDSIVTIGIEPTFPATGFGYIECAETAETGTKTQFSLVKRFVEKPDSSTARRYVKSGRFRWNAGMFVWRERVMEEAFAAAAPEFLPLVTSVASAANISAVLRRMYPAMRATSVDYAVMEKTKNILVAKSSFKWDDVGSWQALPNHFPADEAGNIRLGKTAMLDSSGSIIVSSENHLTAVLGLKDIVVVHTPNATLVCPRDKVQEIKRLVKKL
jgi:mannose-1-phosphate guanylyltransferase